MEGPKPIYAVTLILEDTGDVVMCHDDEGNYFAVYSLPAIGDTVRVGEKYYEVLKISYNLERMSGADVHIKVRETTF